MRRSFAQVFFPFKTQWWRGVRPRESATSTWAPCWRSNSIELNSPIWQAMCNKLQPWKALVSAIDASLKHGPSARSWPRSGLEATERSRDTFCTEGRSGPLQLLRELWATGPFHESAPARLAKGDRVGSLAPIACSKVVLTLASAVINRRRTSCSLLVDTASHSCRARGGAPGAVFNLRTNLFSTYCKSDHSTS